MGKNYFYSCYWDCFNGYFRIWCFVSNLLCWLLLLLFILDFSHNFFADNALVSQRVIINLCGIFVMIFANMVLYLIGNPGFQRPVEIEPEHVPFVEW